MDTKLQVKCGGMSECFVYERECTYTNKSYMCISARIQICDVLGRGAGVDTKLQVKCGGMSECFVYEREFTYTNKSYTCISTHINTNLTGQRRVIYWWIVYSHEVPASSRDCIKTDNFPSDSFWCC